MEGAAQPVSIDWSTALVDLIDGRGRLILNVHIVGDVDTAFRLAFEDALIDRIPLGQDPPLIELLRDSISARPIAGTQPADARLKVELDSIVQLANGAASGMRAKLDAVADHFRTL